MQHRNSVALGSAAKVGYGSGCGHRIGSDDELTAKFSPDSVRRRNERLRMRFVSDRAVEWPSKGRQGPPLTSGFSGVAHRMSRRSAYQPPRFRIPRFGSNTAIGVKQEETNMNSHRTSKRVKTEGRRHELTTNLTQSKRLEAARLRALARMRQESRKKSVQHLEPTRVVPAKRGLPKVLQSTSKPVVSPVTAKGNQKGMKRVRLKCGAKLFTKFKDGSWRPGVVIRILGKGKHRKMRVKYDHRETIDVTTKRYSWRWLKDGHARDRRRKKEIRRGNQAADTLAEVGGSMDQGSKARRARAPLEMVLPIPMLA